MAVSRESTKNTDWASFDKIFISKSSKLLGDKVEIFLGGKMES